MAHRPTLKKLRVSLGTQEKVAQDMGISTIYLRKIESGSLMPGRDLMFKMSSYFNEKPENLFPDYFECGSDSSEPINKLSIANYR